MDGRNEEAAVLIHCFPECLIGLFDCYCFDSFRKVFVAGFSTTFTFRFLEVGSPRPINRGQFAVDGDEDGHDEEEDGLASDVETDKSDSSAMSLEAKLMSAN